jgi:hypothetical protein
LIAGRIGVRRFSSCTSESNRRFAFSGTRSSRSGVATITASAACTTGFIAATSCTRTIDAPFRIAVVTAAAVANSSARASSAFPKNDFREAATNTGTPSRCNSASRARIS